MSVLLAMLTLASCQTLSGSKLPNELNRTCPEFNFKVGKLMPQVVRLKTQYELCRANNDALVELFDG